jgi:hypothetical protein
MQHRPEGGLLSNLIVIGVEIELWKEVYLVKALQLPRLLMFATT